MVYAENLLFFWEPGITVHARQKVATSPQIKILGTRFLMCFLVQEHHMCVLLHHREKSELRVTSHRKEGA